LKNSLIFFVLLVNISFSQNIDISFIREFNINSIASASGVEIINDTTYIISDDQSNLFLTSDFAKINKVEITDNKDIRIDKLYKLDFEALGKINIESNDFLLIVSSGSKFDYRDTVYLYQPNQRKIISKRNFRGVYNRMKTEVKLSEWASINIEAVSTDNKYVYLFQRGNIDGNNVIFRFDKIEFFQYIVGKRNSLDFDFKKFKLPILNEIKAGFSGACFLNKNEMIFTASLENTPNEYHDGEIMGSYIGIVNYETEKLEIIFVKKNNDVLQTKLESVCITNKENNNFILLLSSDNDDGVSQFFEIKLTRNNGSN
jgi:hypothetical protein